MVNYGMELLQKLAILAFGAHALFNIKGMEGSIYRGYDLAKKTYCKHETNTNNIYYYNFTWSTRTR